MKLAHSHTKIPLVDLKAQYAQIKDEIDAAIERVVSTTQFIQGQDVRQFEEAFASYCGVQKNAAVPLFCASCANGTDALELALKAFNVGADDEIITVSYTFFATGEAILSAGATPVFVEIDPKTMLMDPLKIEDKITSKTKGIIAVHLYGQPCDMDQINQIAKRHGLFVIEDAAQAHGAYWNDQRVGSLGDLACFSFFPGKNLGCFGDGGAVVGKDDALIKKVKQLACHGRAPGEKYIHQTIGRNSRLDNLQAAILNVKLKYLDEWIEKRQAVAANYTQALSHLPLQLPSVDPKAQSVWHLYIIRTQSNQIRDALLQFLKEQNIGAGLHYPVPIHLQPAIANDFQCDLPLSEQACETLISLPIYPELDSSQIEIIVNAVDMFFKENPNL